MKWFAKLFSRSNTQDTRQIQNNKPGLNGVKKNSLPKEPLNKDIEKMAAEIYIAANELLKDLKKEINIDRGKETNIILTLFPLFLNIHDRILFARFGNATRSLYIDGIANKMYEMFKVMFEKGNQIDMVSFRHYLNEHQTSFSQYKEIISKSNNLSESLIWHIAKTVMKEIGNDDNFDLCMKVYTLIAISVDNFSVHKV